MCYLRKNQTQNQARPQGKDQCQSSAHVQTPALAPIQNQATIPAPAQTPTAGQTFSNIATSTTPAPKSPILETLPSPDKPITMLKRIGITTYQIAVHFSNTSRETISDKVARMIKNDVEREVVGL